jgi:16S rRNA (cytosine1402-N4)-methyltransferase
VNSRTVPHDTGAPHVPVLLAEVLAALDPQPEGRYLDGTFGAGGYTRAILDAAAGTSVVAIDRDPQALQAGQDLVMAYDGRLQLVEGCFGDLAAIAQARQAVPLDGIVLDIGVSSMQIDTPERGFSFRFDGPLDMRMAQSGQTAADLVNHLPEGELADLIYRYGEERKSRLVAKAIVAARREARIETTLQLAGLIASVVYHKPDDIHPATRTFQALRIAVNDELGELERALEAADAVLGEGGKLVVVTFHSLEDRIVKQFMADKAGRTALPSRHAPALDRQVVRYHAVTRKPVVAGDSEIFRNPRARSAKLRAIAKLGSHGGRAQSWDA